jgi:hypothetical protein
MHFITEPDLERIVGVDDLMAVCRSTGEDALALVPIAWRAAHHEPVVAARHPARRIVLLLNVGHPASRDTDRLSERSSMVTSSRNTWRSRNAASSAPGASSLSSHYRALPGQVDHRAMEETAPEVAEQRLAARCPKAGPPADWTRCAGAEEARLSRAGGSRWSPSFSVLMTAC